MPGRCLRCKSLDRGRFRHRRYLPLLDSAKAHQPLPGRTVAAPPFFGMDTAFTHTRSLFRPPNCASSLSMSAGIQPLESAFEFHSVVEIASDDT